MKVSHQIKCDKTEDLNIFQNFQKFSKNFFQSFVKGELTSEFLFFYLFICDLTSINSYTVHNISLEFPRIAVKY